MNSYLIQQTAPSESIATLAELKAQLRIDGNHEDTLLQTYLDAATNQIETESGSCFVPQVWHQNQECFDSSIHLLKKNFSSIVVKYYDSNNTLQTVSSTNYTVIQYGYPGVYFLPSYARPSTYQRPDAVRFELTFDGNHRLKPVAKQSCLLLAANWFKNRESETALNTKPLIHGFDRAMDILRTGIRI